jgi:lipoate-protein ligase A
LIELSVAVNLPLPCAQAERSMLLFDVSLKSPAENLALDEALLERAESACGKTSAESLRFWEPSVPVVVIGRSSNLSAEVHVERCLERNVPVLRRSSGGAAIVTGPGCLMYALVISLESRPQHTGIDRIHADVLGRHAAVFARHFPGACRRGTSDLALGDRKFSGNSLRIRRHWALYHGTFLYGFQLNWVEQLLRVPSRQPSYRAGRSHLDFLTNLPLDAETIRREIAGAWSADSAVGDLPRDEMDRLLRDKYRYPLWHQRGKSRCGI